MMKIRRKEVLAYPLPKKATSAFKQKETQMNDNKLPPSNLKNQAQVVLAALNEGDRTTIDFIVDFQILGIAARISELRRHYKISTNLLPSGMARYHLEGKKDG